MKKGFKLFTCVTLLILVLSIALTGCGSKQPNNSGTPSNADAGDNDSAKKPEKVFDVSLPLGKDSHHDVGIQKFREELEKRTNGRLSVKPHYNNALGGEREAIEGMMVNTIDMAISSTGPLGGFVKEIFMFDLPYLFKDVNHAYAVLDGEIGDFLEERIAEDANIVVLGWMENGVRNNTNNVRPLNTPSDLVGIKHRTQESEVQLDTWTALGASATPMAWTEVFTALQQGVIDSQENPLATIREVRFDEVQKYLNLTQHVYSPAPLMISKQLFDTLSPEDQQAMFEAAAVAVPVQRAFNQAQEEEIIKDLEAKGMTVTRPDLEPFRQAVEPVYEKWAPRIDKDLIERVRNYKYE
ncbi:TRAP transporter substrate-binding protein [Petroclostridium sp. X23]|uniref:TRAP transporter substrate-binding protein n=1 Tax=Petroclostridium sp. X23 TaxID=3045146 RepID=UPI0024ACFEE7|nr:TRAP transporter substrate-binding protein [Petroclostridium sp. X23]WHH59047.1 TRAP transporter substrate-binding protein [Petroclostridium sp. X23]